METVRSAGFHGKYLHVFVKIFMNKLQVNPSFVKFRRTISERIYGRMQWNAFEISIKKIENKFQERSLYECSPVLIEFRMDSRKFYHNYDKFPFLNMKEYKIHRQISRKVP